MDDKDKLSRREFGLLMAAAPLAARERATRRQAKQKGESVKEAAAFRARPFPLSQVRLLSGTCYTLQDRNRIYLHTLDPDRLLHRFGPCLVMDHGAMRRLRPEITRCRKPGSAPHIGV